MVQLTPEIAEMVNGMNAKDLPALRDLDEIILAEMRGSCRLDIPLRTKHDFLKVSQVLGELSVSLAQTASNHQLTTLEALQRTKHDVDRANRLIRSFCPATKCGSIRKE